MKSHFPSIFLTIALGLTGIICIGQAWHDVTIPRLYERNQQRHLRFEQLRGVILHLDETLTMSARMAAATGDAQWEKRYRQFEPQLDAAIKEIVLVSSADPVAQRLIAQTDAANLKLVEMEQRTFGLVQSGDAEAARQLMFSPTYEEQKRIYAESMTCLMTNTATKLTADASEARSRAHFWMVVGLMGLVATAAIWVMVMRRLRHWGRTLNMVVAERTATLAKSEEELRDFLENANDMIQSVTPAGQFLYVNRAWRATLGYSDEELRAMTVFDLIPEACRTHCLETFTRVQNGESLSNVPVTFRAKDGRLVLLEGSINCRMEAGRPSSTRGIFRDVTLVTAQRQELALLAHTVEQTAEAIAITDLAGTIRYVNPAFEKITGYSKAEALGQNPRILKSGKQDEAFYRELWATLRRGEVWAGHFINKSKDGLLFETEATISPVRDAAGVPVNYIAVQRDVTQEKQLEHQLRQAQKVETIGRLAGGVAHDFNNILTVIIGYCDLLMVGLPKGGVQHNSMREIHSAALRAASLTQRLLAFSRKQVLQPKVLNLAAAVADIEPMLRRLIGENIELVVKTSPNLGSVKADPGQIEQLLMNLVVNARDAMLNGGKLVIETANGVLDEHYAATHHEVLPGDYVVIAVSDTGSGMSEEIIQHLFEPYFTTKPQGKGTGLGLATCHGIVKQSGGHISVYSAPDQGTTFRVYLPRLALLAAEIRPPQPAGAMPRGTETILLVEDEPQLRDLAELVLRGLGYDVLAAAGGGPALELLGQRNGKGVDLLLTDVVMPQMNGRELAEKFHERLPAAKVLLMSGYTADIIGQQGIVDESIQLLEKPYTPSKLAHRVREALDAPAAG